MLPKLSVSIVMGQGKPFFRCSCSECGLFGPRDYGDTPNVIGEALSFHLISHGRTAESKKGLLSRS